MKFFRGRTNNLDEVGKSPVDNRRPIRRNRIASNFRQVRQQMGWASLSQGSMKPNTFRVRFQKLGVGQASLHKKSGHQMGRRGQKKADGKVQNNRTEEQS